MGGWVGGRERCGGEGGTVVKSAAGKRQATPPQDRTPVPATLVAGQAGGGGEESVGEEGGAVVKSAAGKGVSHTAAGSNPSACNMGWVNEQVGGGRWWRSVWGAECGHGWGKSGEGMRCECG